MTGGEELRVPSVASAENVAAGQKALKSLRTNTTLALAILRAVGGKELSRSALDAHTTAVNLLENTLETLFGGLETVIGKHEPTAAERTGR